MSKHYFASDGNYGDGDLVVILDTTNWGPVDWARVDGASDDDRWIVAQRIADGVEVYRVTYHVNLVHEIYVEARSEYQARERFSYLYENHQNEMPEYVDIDHSVENVEVAEDWSWTDTVFGLDHE